MHKCPNCASSKINRCRHPNSEVWCNNCGFILKNEGSTEYNAVPKKVFLVPTPIVPEGFVSAKFKKKVDHEINAKMICSDCNTPYAYCQCCYESESPIDKENK